VDAKLLVGGESVDDTGQRIPVLNPFTGEEVATVPDAGPRQIEAALDSAEKGARAAARLSSGRRAAVLERVAALVESEVEQFAALIVSEQGKTLPEARREAERVPPLLRLCAGEARRLSGETIPLDQSDDGIGRLGLTLRVPAGVVVAITPFNYPLLLVAHKLGPAFAAGNAVILKPATTTPLSGLRLAELFVEAGAEPGSVQCITGSGSRVGAALAADPRVRAITFTGSEPAGRAITSVAGVKKLLLELGANCPLIVTGTADIEQAAAATAVGGYSNAGQACISAQRVIVERTVYADFVDALVTRVGKLTAGDPMSESVSVGPLINADEARRVEGIVRDAAGSGARVLQGGLRDGALYQPTVLADVSTNARIFSEELFGPAVAVTPVDSVTDAIALANASDYGLGAGIFTSNLDVAMRFVREMEAGVIQVNWSPLWRADSMPYGGLKRSGIGKEGPRWAVEELTESKTVVFHPGATEN
jgi:acyl-CoA reductase-like NAD-dependent aldehyde dehydrogenase